MAGYGGQLVALDAETPTELAQAAATADQSQTQAQLARQTLPAEVAMKNAQVTGANITNASNALNLRLAQQYDTFRQAYLNKLNPPQSAGGSQLDSSATGASTPASPLAASSPAVQAPSALFDPRVQQVMQSIDPGDPNAGAKFDAGMTAIEGEVPQAAQFVGNYSRSSLQNWRSQIGSHAVAATAASPLSGIGTGASSATTPLAGAPMTHPITGEPDAALSSMAILDPESTGKMLSMQGMIRYQQTGDPTVLARYAPELYEKLTEATKNMSDAQKTAIATKTSTMGQQANAVLALAHDLKDPTGTTPEVRAAYNAALTEAAKNGWITPQVAQAKMNAPVDMANLAYLAAQSQTVTEYMTSSGATAANEARAKAANPEPESVVAGYDSTGRPIYHNAHSPAGTPDTVGNVAAASTRNGTTSFDAKQAAWLAVNPGDAQGALEFANGQHTMTPGQASIAAANAASKDAQVASLSGQPFNEAAARASYYQMFTAPGGAGPTPSAPRPSATPVAPGQPAPAQLQAAQPFNGSTAPQGSDKNPYLPTTQAQYARLPKGAHYIYVDGSIRTKQ